jgi:hypothetical protein
MSKPLLSPPSREKLATARDLIEMQAALSDLMEEEANLMEAMQVGKVGELQDRKLKLTSMVERTMHCLKTHPEVLSAATASEKEELRRTAERFRRVMKKNYDTLLVARAVNRSVVKCVTQFVSRNERNPVYNASGVVQTKVKNMFAPVSMTYNQTV